MLPEAMSTIQQLAIASDKLERGWRTERQEYMKRHEELMQQLLVYSKQPGAAPDRKKLLASLPDVFKAFVAEFNTSINKYTKSLMSDPNNPVANKFIANITETKGTTCILCM